MEIFINYTPHEIEVRRESDKIIFPSHGVARVTEEQSIVGTHSSCEIRKTVYKEIVGLPEPIDRIKYIVSIVVAQANSKSPNPRDDLVCPDTGLSCIRNEKGAIIAVTGFTVV